MSAAGTLPAQHGIAVREKQPVQISTLTGFVIGAIAACTAVTLTNPAELVKTRLQLLGEGTGPGTPPQSLELYRKSPLVVLRTLYVHEGVRGIQRGLSAAYVYQILLNGSRLGLFEPVRRVFSNWGFSNYFASMFSGATCGAFGAAVASPLFLVKTRMQSFSMAYPVGTQHAYVRKGLVHSFVTISKNEGLASIFKGVEVGIMRTAVGSAIQLSTYTTLKSRFAQWGLGAETDLRNNLPASLLTGFAVAMGMNPFDVVMNRLMNQVKSDPSVKPYRNSLDCLFRTVKDEGLMALTKGYVAHFLRIGPHGVFTLVLTDQLRSLYVKWKSA